MKATIALVLATLMWAGNYIVGAIVVWSLYPILGRTGSVPPITATAVQATMVVVLPTPIGLATGASWPADPVIGWAVLFIAIFPSIGAYALWNFALKGIPPGRAGLYLNLIAVFTVLISVIMGAQLTLPQIVGGLLVFAGVALSSLRRERSVFSTSSTSAVVQ